MVKVDGHISNWTVHSHTFIFMDRPLSYFWSVHFNDSGPSTFMLWYSRAVHFNTFWSSSSTLLGPSTFTLWRMTVNFGANDRPIWPMTVHFGQTIYFCETVHFNDRPISPLWTARFRPDAKNLAKTSFLLVLYSNFPNFGHFNVFFGSKS